MYIIIDVTLGRYCSFMYAKCVKQCVNVETNSSIRFPDAKNIYLDTKIIFLCQLLSGIQTDFGALHMRSFLGVGWRLRKHVAMDTKHSTVGKQQW